MNLLDYEKCKKIQEVLNLIYENIMIPTINKPTRVTRQSSIPHILTNWFVNFNFKTSIFKSDIFDHFSISFFLPITNEFSKTELIYIHKIIINDYAIETFCQKLHETDWVEIEIPRNPNVCYEIFYDISLYDEYFPIKIAKVLG